MLRSLKEIEGYMVIASDGDVGCVIDFLFDDEYWTIRYLVVQTGGFFGDRLVLISPISFHRIDWSTRCFQLSLSLVEIRSSPDIDLRSPVSRDREREYCQHFRYPYYWNYSGLWGKGPYPGLLSPDLQRGRPIENLEDTNDVHLQSARAVRGYRVLGHDEPLGHIEDFIVDDESWAARYLAVDTTSWRWERQVLLVPHWATQISWSERTLRVEVTQQAVKDSPEWNPLVAPRRDYEVRLYSHYGKPVYWDASGRAITPPPAHHIGNPT